jgi:hypothetical protein
MFGSRATQWTISGGSPCFLNKHFRQAGQTAEIKPACFLFGFWRRYVVHVVDGVVRAKGLVNTLEQIDWVLDIGAERSRLAA